MKLFLKPHHFLDILKLYGMGVEKFVPDKKYQHHFYKVGNAILKNPLAMVSLTVGVDDICKPCRFLKEKKCVDKTKGFVYSSKEKWNRIIDKRILRRLDLKENDKMVAIELCQMIEKKLIAVDIAKIWKEKPTAETKKRIKHFFIGLKKYMKRVKIRKA